MVSLASVPWALVTACCGQTVSLASVTRALVTACRGQFLSLGKYSGYDVTHFCGVLDVAPAEHARCPWQPW